MSDGAYERLCINDHIINIKHFPQFGRTTFGIKFGSEIHKYKYCSKYALKKALEITVYEHNKNFILRALLESA
jgi:hypothetical protein